MTKAETKATNRTLAAALRAEGITPNGEPWSAAKDMLAQGLPPQAAARLVRSTLPEREQVKAMARKRAQATKAGTPKRRLTPEEIARGIKALPKVEHAPVSQAPKRTPQRAQDVKAGKVMRDAKGRLMSREAQREIEDTLALLNG